MRVLLNGEPMEVEASLTVEGLVQRHTGRENPLGIAVARNGRVVPRSQWTHTNLDEADEIELVGIMQGG
jgi:sulfur carrier protein